MATDLQRRQPIARTRMSPFRTIPACVFYANEPGSRAAGSSSDWSATAGQPGEYIIYLRKDDKELLDALQRRDQGRT